MILKLLKYKIQLQYLPGKYIHVAVLLSRSYLKMKQKVIMNGFQKQYFQSADH